jgi:hypothetical protein
MVISLRKWMKRGKFLILFLVFTYLIFLLLNKISLWVEPEHRYNQPIGDAVKVTLQDGMYNGENSVKDRLRFFYWYGE